MEKLHQPQKLDHVDGRDPEQSPHEIKYSFYAWLVYVIFLTPRVLLIFLNFAEYRKKIEFNVLTVPGNVTTTPLPPPTEHHGNLLKIIVSITPLIYLSLMYGSHNAEPLTARTLSIQSVAASGALDLFDSMDLLELLFEDERGIPNAYAYIICFFASVNFFLPALSLYDIRIKTVKGRVKSLPLKIINMLCVMGFVNIPNLSLRAILWQKYGADVSVLIMKNVLCLTLGFYELAEYFGEKAPRKCKVCKEMFDCTAFASHEMKCSEQTIELTDSRNGLHDG